MQISNTNPARQADSDRTFCGARFANDTDMLLRVLSIIALSTLPIISAQIGAQFQSGQHANQDSELWKWRQTAQGWQKIYIEPEIVPYLTEYSPPLIHPFVWATASLILLILITLWASSEWDRCLLYTSPSPRDRTRSRMPSSA